MFSFAGVAIVSAFVASSMYAVTALPSGCDRTYVVQVNDTCDSICAANNVSSYQLSAVNSGVIDPNCYDIYPGETICLGITGQDCNVTYTMQSSDTCATIAAAADISLNTFLTNNPNVNPICSNIYPGETFCTSSTIYVNLTSSE